MEVMRRKDAIAAGLVRYVNGNPCPRGHVGPRFASSGTCCECMLQFGRAGYQRHREKHVERTRKRRAENPELILAQRRIAYARVPEKHRQRSRQWRLANPEIMQKIKRSYRERNADQIRADSQARRAADPQKYRDIYKRWETSNPETRRAINANRRARQRGAEGKFTKEDVRRITERQGHKCAHCGEFEKLTVDHVRPLSKGGTNWPSNIQMLCKPCNSRKKDRYYG